MRKLELQESRVFACSVNSFTLPGSEGKTDSQPGITSSGIKSTLKLERDF